jgi:cytochrome c oxidase subunit 2
MLDILKVLILGVDLADPYAQDDIVVKITHSKAKNPFKMRSQDVLHSAYMPYLEHK